MSTTPPDVGPPPDAHAAPDGSAESQPPPPMDVYAIFSGATDPVGSERFIHNMTALTHNRLGTVNVLLQSTGGTVGDGVFLYNCFRSAPFQLVGYNGGQVSSAAVTAYLGFPRRVVSKHATFMIHRSYTNQQFGNSTRLQRTAESLVLDDNRTEAILRENASLPDDLWDIWRHHDLHISAEDAVRYGIAHEIGDFTPPPNRALYDFLFSH
jgi:ATP-dependent Clp protease, protease subunit